MKIESPNLDLKSIRASMLAVDKSLWEKHY